jgi:hypothetical protein
MAYFVFLPLAVLSAVALAVCAVLVLVERGERRRSILYAALKTRRPFQPRVIEGGRKDAPTKRPAAAEAADKLAG